MTEHIAGVKEISLSAFLYADANYNALGWCQPDSDADAGLNFTRWVDYVSILEGAKLDMLFVADTTSALGVDRFDNFCRTARNFGFEPITLLSALSSLTTHIGLAATISTSWCGRRLQSAAACRAAFTERLCGYSGVRIAAPGTIPA